MGAGEEKGRQRGNSKKGKCGTQGERCEMAWAWCVLPLHKGQGQDLQEMRWVRLAEPRSRMVKSVGDPVM